MIKQARFDVAGAEYDRKGCEIACAVYPDILFHNIGYDSPEAVFQGQKFDCVVSTEVIEHLFAPQWLPKFATAVLRPNGYLIVSKPYHGFLKNLMLSLANHWDAHHTPFWEGGHIKFWGRKTLTTLLSQNGFDTIEFYGAGRVPY